MATEPTKDRLTGIRLDELLAHCDSEDPIPEEDCARWDFVPAAIGTRMSIADFIAADYGREFELVDGELRERHVGNYSHSRIEALLGAWFIQNEDGWGAVALIEMDTIILPSSFLKPDVALVPFGAAPDRLVDPPLLTIEVLSPSDTLRKQMEKCEQYRELGVRSMWIIDPENRTGWAWDGDQWVEARRLEASGTEIYIDLGYLFERLDASRRS
jgi:Uma2 family endonuclease